MKIYSALLLFLLLFSLPLSLSAQTLFNDQLSYEEIDSIQVLLYNKGDYKNCINFTERVLDKVAKESGKEDTLYAFYQKDLGTFYYEFGDYEKSASNYFSAQNIIKTQIGKSDIRYIKSINGLGAAYQMSNRYDEAVIIFKELEHLINKQWDTNPVIFSIILNNLARLYWIGGNLKKAEALLIKIKNIQKEKLGELDKDYAITLSNLAILYKDLKQYDKAAPLFEQVKRIRYKVLGDQHPYYATGLHDLGAFYTLAQKYDAAEKMLKEALALQEKLWGMQHAQSARTLLSLGNLYFKKNDLKQAEEYIIKSIWANTEVETATFSIDKIHEYDYLSNQLFHVTIRKLLNLYEIQYKNGNSERINEYYTLVKYSILLAEKWKNSFNSDKNKLVALTNNLGLVKKGIKASLIINTETAKKEAFRFAELNKSILLTDAIKGTAARSLGYLPDSLSRLEEILQKELYQLKNKKSQAGLKEERAKINSLIFDLELKKDAFIKKIKKEYPKYYQLKYRDISVNVEEVQETLDSQTLLLEYFVTDTVLYLFSISKTSINIYPIPVDEKDWTLKLNQNRQALTDFKWIVDNMEQSYTDYTTSAHWLYENILSVALEDHSTIKRLIIIPDEALGYLPFETLLTSKPSSILDYKKLPYLLNKYTISYNYSATLWKQNLTKKKQATYNSEILSYAAEYSNSSLDADSINLLNRGIEENEIRGLLKPLKSAQEEVNKLKQTYKGYSASGTNANERSFKDQAPEYGIIHLAMHGVLNPEKPLLSSLVFSENYDSLENNFLYAYEISKLNLNANLAVLSACETGYGEFEQGEGIISLGRSFMYAGVPSLIVSLWSVNDFSTAIIMEDLYKNLNEGMYKDEALRQAKINYLKHKNGLVSHPAFWSAFVQIGNAQPIQINRRSNFNTWYLIGGVFGIILILIVLFRIKAAKFA